MKYNISLLLISAAIAMVANGAPTISINQPPFDNTFNLFNKRCAECTHIDRSALDSIATTSAYHYAEIAHSRLDSLMEEINTVKVSSGYTDLPHEKSLLIEIIKVKV